MGGGSNSSESSQSATPQIDYSALGRSIGGATSRFGQTYAQAQQAPTFGAPYQGSQGPTIPEPGQSSAGLIPTSQNDVLTAIARLLSNGGGY